MTQSDKLKQLIEGVKTSNEVMKKQIEIQIRTIELLGQYVTEPESVELTNIKPEDMVSGEWYVVEVIGVNGWLIKIRTIENEKIYTSYSVNLSSNNSYSGNAWNHYPFTGIRNIKSIRKATREEILKYFPHEFEIPTHGGNDIPNIPQVTDEQL